MVLASRRESVCMYVGIYSASLYIYIYNYIRSNQSCSDTSIVQESQELESFFRQVLLKLACKASFALWLPHKCYSRSILKPCCLNFHLASYSLSPLTIAMLSSEAICILMYTLV